MERVSLGVPRLDLVLGGGLPKDSLAILGGGPGAGKTIFTLQWLFLSALRGSKGVYFSTLMFPRVVEFYRNMGFFHEDLMDNGVFFVDLGKEIRQGNLQTILSEVTKHIQNYEAEHMVIDSFRELAEIAPSRLELWTFVNELRSQLPEAGCTGILTGDYAIPEDLGGPEFGVADAVINLEVQRSWNTATRLFRVYKLRGSKYVEGYHAYEITDEGFMPIVSESPAATKEPPEGEGRALPELGPLNP